MHWLVCARDGDIGASSSSTAQQRVLDGGDQKQEMSQCLWYTVLAGCGPNVTVTIS